MDRIKKFSTALDIALAEHTFPGCSFLYLEQGGSFVVHKGHFTYEPDAVEVNDETIYDVASITKIVTTMTLGMILIDEGVLRLDDTVSRYIPEYELSPEKRAVTVAHMMTYTIDYDIPQGAKSLLPRLTAKQVYADVLANSLKCMPGTKYQYTNITAFLLTQVIERVTGKRFDELVTEKIFSPLGMAMATFHPTDAQLHHIPPTEVTNERGEVRGVTHDEFSYYLTRGGINTGAAGLFTPVKDLENFLRMTLSKGKFNGQQFVSPQLVAQWTEDLFPVALPFHTPLAWGDLNNVYRDKYHNDLVVKGGFTGCFMMADFRTGRGFALLSNRTYPERPTGSVFFAKLKDSLMEIVME